MKSAALILGLTVGCATAPKPVPTCDELVKPYWAPEEVKGEAFPLAGDCTFGVGWVSQVLPEKHVKYLVGTTCKPETLEIARLGGKTTRLGECLAEADGKKVLVVAYMGEVVVPNKKTLRL